MTTGSLYSDISNFVEIADGVARAVHTNFIREFARVLIRRTPVDTGLLRGSWNVSVGSGAFMFLEQSEDPTGVATLQRIDQQINGIRITNDTSTFIVNIADYASVLEMGTSKQAPNGFFRITLLEAPAIFERVAATTVVRARDARGRFRRLGVR